MAEEGFGGFVEERVKRKKGAKRKLPKRSFPET
jgi:hypothetical protein